ncbi:MAG TPA: metallophosphoesterase [Spirochaetales bacterium]|nr:metallophosphoesterase [Spirochaetales bacterium]
MKRIHDDSGSHAAIWLSIAAFAAHAAFLGWAFLQAGTLGMYRWGHGAPVLMLSALGIAPLALSIAMVLVFCKKKTPKAAIIIVSVVAVLSLLAAVTTSLFVFSNAYGKSVDASMRPIIIEPAKGLQLSDSHTLRVLISSDPHMDRDISSRDKTRSLLAYAQTQRRANNLDAFFVLGDTVEMGMYKAGWDITLNELRTYAPDVPFSFLMGNHDSLIGGSKRWKAAVGPVDSPRMWRMDAGTVHFIALDLLWGPEGFSAKDKTWLVAQLDSIPKEDYTVVLSHCYFWASGYKDAETGMEWYDHPDMIQQLSPLLEGKADLVVSGHNHFMEWLQSPGTAWAVVGAMGGVPDKEPDYRSQYSRWFMREVFGALELTLTDSGLSCAFLDHEGKQLQSFIIP